MKFSALSTQALLASSCLVVGSLNTVSGSEKNTVVQKPAGFLRRGLTSYADWKKQQDKQNGKPQGSDKPEKSIKDEEPASLDSLESLEEVSEESLESLDGPSAEHKPEKAPKEEKPTKENGKPDKPEKPIKEEKPTDETIEDEVEELEEELEEVEDEMEELEDELEELEVETENGRPDVPPGQAKKEEKPADEGDKEPSVESADSLDEDEDEDLFDAYCESVWAYSPGTSTCFSDIEGLKTNRWGWSVGPLADGPTILDIYAGAGGCDLEKGLLLGRAHVMYNVGMDELSIDFERALSELPEDTPLEYEEISWYIGHEPVFQKANGKYTVAPGQFPYQESHIEGSLPANAVQFDVGSVSDGLTAPLYLTLHGVVCDTAADQL